MRMRAVALIAIGTLLLTASAVDAHHRPCHREACGSGGGNGNGGGSGGGSGGNATAPGNSTAPSNNTSPPPSGNETTQSGSDNSTTEPDSPSAPGGSGGDSSTRSRPCPPVVFTGGKPRIQADPLLNMVRIYPQCIITLVPRT